MTDKKRFSVAAMLRSVQAFAVTFSFFVLAYASFGRFPLEKRGVVALVALAVFIADTAILRSVDNRFFIALTGVLSVAAVLPFASDTADIVCFALMVGTGYIYALYERRLTAIKGRKQSSFMSSLKGVLAILAFLVISTYLKQGDTTQWLFSVAALYVPLSVGAWLNERIEKGLNDFENKSTQPTSSVRKNVSSYATLSIITVFLLALFMPYGSGKTLFAWIFDGVRILLLALAYVIEKIFDLFGVAEEGAQEGNVYDAFEALNQGSNNNELLEILYTIIVFVAVAATVGYLIFKLIKLVVWLIKRYIEITNGRKFGSDYDSEDAFDTVELIEIGADAPRRNRIFGVLSIEDKMRACYKRKIRQLIKKHDIFLSGTETPDEITEIVKKYGVDISELTALYKKARYFCGCTQEDLISIRRL